MNNHQEAAMMKRMFGIMMVAGFSLAIGSQANAQVWHYPPADGIMYTVPPVFLAPDAIGAPYVEVPPTFTPSEASPAVNAPEDRMPVQAKRQSAAKAKGKAARSGRAYVRDHGRDSLPYQTALPVGQLYWPGAYFTPAYSPTTRFQNYDSAYGRGPYGSGFYSGYYKGFPMIGY